MNAATTVQAQPRQRTFDLVATGGAGYYSRDSAAGFQPTANIEFFAQTSILDLTAGVHLGFSDPLTKAFNVGLRFPISGTATNGIYFDASALFFDGGVGDDAFSSGLRAALAARVEPVQMEYRAVGEIRQIFSGSFEAWAGLEAGFFINLVREDIREPERKDSVLADLQYIATQNELKAMRNAKTDHDLDTLLASFWKARDVTPATPINEAKREYERRIAIVDSAFGTNGQLGARTDQGRVILLYGEPNRIESAVSSYDNRVRYQLWVYEGRVKGYSTALFLFRNARSAMEAGVTRGDFRQVYSNLPGEESEPLTDDIPPSMRSYILSFGH